MAILQYALALIVTLGVLVLFHELGHYIIARWSGARVVKFSIGFGRSLWSKTDSRGCEWAIAGIPLGGYVRLLDVRDPEFDQLVRAGDVPANDLHPWWRIAIFLGGPLANFILAWLVYWVLAFVGTQEIIPTLMPAAPDAPITQARGPDAIEPKAITAVDGKVVQGWQDVTQALAARLGDTGTVSLSLERFDGSAKETINVPISDWHRGANEPDLLGSLGIAPAVPATFAAIEPNTPAANSALRLWDTVIAVDGAAVGSWSELVEKITAAPDRELRLSVLRGGRERQVLVTPEGRPNVNNEPRGFLGVGPPLQEVRYSAGAAFGKASSDTWDKTVLTLALLKKMVVGDVSASNLSGPITIARVAGDSAASGWNYYLGILALISISLGILNLLPIPILDGGKILFAGAELAMGRPVSERFEWAAMQIGLVFIGGLMVLALYNDIARLL